MQTHALRDEDVISRRASVVAADTMDETILLDIDSGYFFQLNTSAARIWTLVEQPRSFADLCSEVQSGFAVASERCRSEVSNFVGELRDRGLLEIGS